MLIKIIRDNLIKITPDKDPVIEFSLRFDGNKVPAIIQVYHVNKSVVCGVSEAHFIDISGKTDAEVREMINPKSPIKREKEVKVVVVSFQRPGVRKSPYENFGTFQQGPNARTNFNEEVTDVCLNICCESNFRVRLVSVDAYGLSV